MERIAENFPKLQRLCLTSNPDAEEWNDYDEICQAFASKRNIKIEIRGLPVLCNFDGGVKSICCGHYKIHPSKEMKIFGSR